MTKIFEDDGFAVEQIQEPKNVRDVVYSLITNPNLAPVNYFNDFTEEGPILEDIAVDEGGLFTTDSGQKLAMTTHAFDRHLETSPQTAIEILITRATRRLVCYGIRPVAVSAFLYHLNIGDPKGDKIAAAAKKGMERAASAFGLQISERKIRFDCSPAGRNPSATLIVSMMGLVENINKILDHKLKKKGNNIFVIGESVNDINSSEYLEFHCGIPNSPLPYFDLDKEVRMIATVRQLIDRQLITSANPIGRGGLFFSLMRAAMPMGVGFDITTDAEIRKDAFLFGESMGRGFVGVPQENFDRFVDFMQEQRIPFFAVGHVTSGEIRIDSESFGFIDKMKVH
ncbi:MAG: hypothetical protein LBR06_09080 [Bacteroidales bacterium]|jgi:phosphoribosylformylglycinamidine synthase|nr:hypothetical protein [Bacteroidales bacterium]